MSNFLFSALNDDGTYEESFNAEIVDMDSTTQLVGDMIPIPSFTEDVELSFELDYKQTKDFVWNIILNLKRCTKHLVSKNICRR